MMISNGCRWRPILQPFQHETLPRPLSGVRPEILSGDIPARKQFRAVDHSVHFILDAVEQLPITDFRVNDRGSGSEHSAGQQSLQG